VDVGFQKQVRFRVQSSDADEAPLAMTKRGELFLLPFQACNLQTGDRQATPCQALPGSGPQNKFWTGPAI
jgi:hypothetical protein